MAGWSGAPPCQRAKEFRLSARQAMPFLLIGADLGLSLMTTQLRFPPA
jgi:hypothetical protein